MQMTSMLVSVTHSGSDMATGERARVTDFYTIVPLPESQYAILIDGIVVAVYSFNSIDDAENYIIESYDDLRIHT